MKMFKKSVFLVLALFVAIFTLASCGGDNTANELEEAAKKIVLTQDKKTDVTGDFEVTSIVTVGENTYNVAWESSSEVAKIGSVNETTKLIPVTIDYVHNNTADTAVKLTATLSKEGKKDTYQKEFNFTVPRFVVNTIAEYDAATSKTPVTIHGVVVAKEEFSSSYKNTSVYLESIDGKGGVYAYRLSCTQEQYDNELKIGARIYVSGNKYVYNGLREFDGGCTYKLETTELNTPTVTDITDTIKAGTEISADLQNQLIKISNLEVLSVEEKDSKDRYNIIVADPADNTKQFTIRVNTYLTPTSGAAYKAYTALNIVPGMTISATGVCGWYNGAQMHPVDEDDIVVNGINYAKVFGGKLLAATSIDDQLYGVKEIVLPDALEDVNLSGDDYIGLTATWTSSSANAVIGSKTITVTPAVEDDPNTDADETAAAVTKTVITLTTATVTEDEDVTLTLTIKNASDEVVDTRTITIKLIKDIIADSHADYVAAADDTNLVVRGVITAYKSNQKEIWIEDADGAYYLYFSNKVEAEWLVIGNEIAVAGVKTTFNNTLELKDCTWLYTYEEPATITAENKTEEFAANGYTTLEAANQGKLITFTGTWLGDKKVKVGEKEIAVYFYCTQPTLTENVEYAVTGLLGFYYNKSTEVYTYQIFILDTNAFADARPADVRAQAALDSIKESIGTASFTQTTDIVLDKIFKDATLTVTPQTDATTLAYDSTTNTLTITPTTTQTTETLTIKVQIGEEVKEETISIVSKVDNSNLTATLAYTSSTSNTTVDGSNDATLVGLDETYFTVVRAKNDASGCALYTNSIRLYGKDGNGASLTITGQTGVTIKSITITFDTSKTDGTYSVNGTAGASAISSGMDPVTIEINSDSVVILNTSTGTTQVRIASIEITYSIAE